MYKKVSKSVVKFLVFHVDDILFIENNVGLLYAIKIWSDNKFSRKV